MRKPKKDCPICKGSGKEKMSKGRYYDTQTCECVFKDGHKKKILFICIHNSARSQMAEEFMKKYGSGSYFSYSAGIKVSKLNPYAVKVMEEIGIDISNNKVKSIEGIMKFHTKFDIVVTVCEEGAVECPFIFADKNLHWNFNDPSSLTGTEEEILEKTRQIRDEIETKIKEFLKQ